MYSFTELAKLAGCVAVALLLVWRCSRAQPTPPQAEFSEPPAIAPDSLLPIAPAPVRDTVSLPGLRALVRQDYRQENFDQLQRDAARLVNQYPTAAAARALAAQRPTIDSLAQAARQRERRKQQRRAQAAAPNAEWAVAYPAENWYSQPYDSDFAEDARGFLTHGPFYGDYTLAGTTVPVVAELRVDSASAMHVLLSIETQHPAEKRYQVGRGFWRHYVGGRAAYTTSRRITVAGPTAYAVEVRAADGHAYHLRATNAQNQLDLEAASARTLHQVLKEGGRIRLVLVQDAPRIRYRFTIANADDYEEGYMGFRSH